MRKRHGAIGHKVPPHASVDDDSEVDARSAEHVTIEYIEFPDTETKLFANESEHSEDSDDIDLQSLKRTSRSENEYKGKLLMSSWVQHHIEQTKDRPGVNKCRYCSLILRPGTGIKNFKRHMIAKHNEIWDELVPTQPKKASMEKESSHFDDKFKSGDEATDDEIFGASTKRTMLGRKRTSWIHNHLDSIKGSNRRARCRYCLLDVDLRNHSNILRHFKRRHTNVWAMCAPKKEMRKLKYSDLSEILSNVSMKKNLPETVKTIQQQTKNTVDDTQEEIEQSNDPSMTAEYLQLSDIKTLEIDRYSKHANTGLKTIQERTDDTEDDTRKQNEQSTKPSMTAEYLQLSDIETLEIEKYPKYTNAGSKKTSWIHNHLDSIKGSNRRARCHYCQLVVDLSQHSNILRHFKRKHKNIWSMCTPKKQTRKYKYTELSKISAKIPGDWKNLSEKVTVQNTLEQMEESTEPSMTTEYSQVSDVETHKNDESPEHADVEKYIESSIDELSVDAEESSSVQGESSKATANRTRTHVRCHLCPLELIRGNLSRHMRRVHPNAYEERETKTGQVICVTEDGDLVVVKNLQSK